MDSKEYLRESGKFGSLDPNELVSFQDWAEYLETILTGPYTIFPDPKSGKNILIEIKATVASIHGIRIEIYPNEHTPPHFHVRSPNIDASFRIVDCSLINGTISPKDFEKVLYWYEAGSKQLLIEEWNKFRPTNCVVGDYSE